jgi:hypothetical protein
MDAFFVATPQNAELYGKPKGSRRFAESAPT